MAVAIDRVVELSRIRSLARSGSARTVRLAAGLSLAEIAATVGVTSSAVFRWENGERAPHGDAALRYGELLEALMTRGRRR